MRPLRRLFLLVLIALLGVVASVPNASSKDNETFGVTPYPEKADGVDRGAFRIPLETGETFEDAVRIYNQTVQELELTVYAADAEAGSGETDISPVTVGFRNDEPKGVGSWIDLAREDVQLAPRDEVIISFRVNVRSADPKPANGAIVVETTGNGSSGARREFLTVLSVPAGTETTSVRIRPLLLRSPWIVVAILGLLVAIALVWIGARRARRPKDVLVPAGEIEQPEIEEDIPVASRPVIKRLGAPEPEPLPAAARTAERPRRSARDGKPLLEDAFLVEVDLPEDDVPEDDHDLEADDELEDELLYEDDVEDEDEDEDEDEEDLPPARPRPAAKRAQPARKSARSSAKSSAKSGQPARVKKAGAKKKTVRPAAKKAVPARRKAPAKKAKPKPKPTRSRKQQEPRGYIPLDEL